MNLKLKLGKKSANLLKLKSPVATRGKYQKWPKQFAATENHGKHIKIDPPSTTWATVNHSELFKNKFLL